MKAYERGLKLLESLGTQVERPKLTVKPTESSNAVCRSCDALVVWASTASGSRVPLDVHPNGDFVISSGVARAYGAPFEGQRRYVTHFAACRAAQKTREMKS